MSIRGRRHLGIRHLGIRHLVLVLLPLLSALALAGNNPAPVNLSFAKSGGEGGVWHGSVSGDIAGSLQTVAIRVDDSSPVWKVEFDFIVSAGEQSFTARLSGTLNTNTGRVVMNGTVTSGYLMGARVHEQGQMVSIDEATGATTFEGTIRLLPATAR